MDIQQISELATTILTELTGFTSPHVIGVKKKAIHWHITIEVVEKSSEAVNLELLGIYEVEMDTEGVLLGYARLRMRKRGDIHNQ
jgi:hypothetical protein